MSLSEAEQDAVRGRSAAKFKATFHRGDLLASYSATALTLFCNLIAYRVCLELLGEQAFAEYSVARRTLSYGAPLLATTVGAALTHYVALSRVKGDQQEGALFRAAFLYQGIVMAAVVLGAFLFPASLSRLFFGQESYRPLILPLVATLAGTALASQCVSAMMGRLEVVKATLFSALVVGVLPLVAVMAAPSVRDLFLIQGAGLALCSLVFYLLTVRPGFSSTDLTSTRSALGSLAGYAVPRVPGVLAQVALVALPVTLTAHRYQDLEIAGVLSVGGTLLTTVGAVIVPLSSLLLPQSAVLKATGGLSRLRGALGKVWLLMTILTLVGCLLSALFLDQLIRLFLSPDLARHSVFILWLIPSIVPYVWYRSFSPILDGIDHRAYNSGNSLLALGGFGLWYGAASVARWPEPPLQANLAGMFILGLLTLYRLAALLKSDSSDC